MGAGPLGEGLDRGRARALAPLILGYTFPFVAIADMSAMAGAVAGGGLGDFAIQYGYQRYNTVAMATTIAVIIVIVQLATVAQEQARPPSPASLSRWGSTG